MAEKKFDLGDYIEVKDRIAKFYELFGQGRLVTGEVRLTNEPDGIPRVMVQGLAYRSPEDTLPGVGWSWMALPGTTSYTKGSELENVETSAWGRAIGSLGILIDRSIASANEVRNKSDGDNPNAGLVAKILTPPPERTPDGGLIGKVELAKDSPDFLPHIGPDGAVLSFKLTSKAGGIKVIARGALAEVIAGAKDETVGVQATCYGRIVDDTFTPKGSTKPITYQVMALERIKTPTYELPALDEPPLEEPPDDEPLFGEVPALGLVK